MLAVIRGLGIASRVRVLSLPGRREFRLNSPVRSEDSLWPWPWWEKPLPSQVTEKKIEWTPVLVITNINFTTGYQRAETRLSWWRTECDG